MDCQERAYARREILIHIDHINDLSTREDSEQPGLESVLDMYQHIAEALWHFLEADCGIGAPEEHLRARMMRQIRDLRNVRDRGCDVMLARSYAFLLAVGKQYLENTPAPAPITVREIRTPRPALPASTPIGDVNPGSSTGPSSESSPPRMRS